MSDMDYERMTDEEIQKSIDRWEAELKGKGLLQKIGFFLYDFLFPKDREGIKKHIEDMRSILESRQS